jgi:hypothetical protein
MSNTSIKLKKSSVSGKIPLVSDIDYGELAINYADGKLYYKHNDTSIRSFLDSGQILYLIDSDYLKSIINSTYLIANRPINLLEDSNPALGNNLNLNGHNITDSGSSGSITMSGNITGGNVTATGDISGTNLISTMSSGDEGGEIKLAKPVTNTSLAGTGVIIDVYQNRLRFFEQGSPNRGAYIDLTTADSNLGTNLLAASAPGDGTLTLAVSGTGLSGSASFTANQYTGSTFTVTSNATSANTAGAIVARDSSGNFTAGVITGDQVISTNNGAGTNFKVGDDVWIGDVNLDNTIRITGQQDATKGYIIFGNSNATALGRSGTGRLTYGGNAVILAGDSGTVTSSMIANTGVAAGTYGSASRVPVLTVNSQGQVDSIGTVSVAGVSSTSWDSSAGNLIINTADGGSYYTKVTLTPYTTSNLNEGTNKYYTQLRADSDARNALTGSTGITYTRSTGVITTNDGQIVHDNLSGFVANEHIDHTSVTLTAGSGLTGGGDISASRTFNIGQGTGITVSADAISTNDGQIVHDNLSGFVANEHIDHSSVSIIAGNGLTGGGTIASTRTLSIDSAQIRGLFSAGTGVTYSSGVISIGQAVGTGNTPTFNGLSASSAKITSLATPTVGTDAANKSYVDTVASASLHYHDPVRVESPINLNATYNNGTDGVGATLTNAGTQAALVVDGVAVDSADRVLVYEQTTQTQNGVYVVTHKGSPTSNWVLTRSADTNSYAASSPTSLGKGDAFYVKEGVTGAGELYVMNTEGTITFGTTNITFSQISSAQIYKAGYGIELSGTTFSVDSDRVVLSVNSLKGNITATNLLDAIKTVDGTTSGLDADLLDGQHGSYYYQASNPNGYTTNTGTVTSVDMTVPTGFAISGRPITSSGTLALTYSAGYQGFTSTEASKLAGIESGATADQSASEILSLLLTVDGASSGLDADLLDGQHGSYYRINVYNSSGTLLN